MVEELFVQGNEACAKGAIKAGCRFFAGYPITPSTEVAENLAKDLPTVGGSFVSGCFFFCPEAKELCHRVLQCREPF